MPFLAFVPNQNDDTLNVALSRGDAEIFIGELECTAGSINIGSDNYTVKATAEDGTYTINEQGIETSAEGLALTATDNQMIFEKSDDEVALRAHFGKDGTYASGVDSLNGTMSDDFNGSGGFQINGSLFMSVYDDNEISISAYKKDFEILGLDPGASLQVSAANTYTVNSAVLEAAADDIIVGTLDDSRTRRQ